MQCKKCGYHLWNIQGRTCPECGVEFSISDYDFVPNAIAFCCPHCKQDYYGTDERGHLEPPAFECVQCANYVEMNQMIVRPGQGYEHDKSTMQEHPWENRDDQTNIFKGWFRTSIAAMLRPAELVKLPPDPNMRSGHWGFMAFNMFLSNLLGVGLIFVVMMIVAMVASPSSAAGFGMGIGMLFGVTFGLTIGILINMGMVAIWGAVSHLCLKLLAQPQGDMTDTFRCVCYANGTTAMVAVPICGPYILSLVGSVWWIVSTILMMMQVHKTSGLKTSIAVLILPLFFIGLITVLFLSLPFVFAGLENSF